MLHLVFTFLTGKSYDSLPKIQNSSPCWGGVSCEPVRFSVFTSCVCLRLHVCTRKLVGKKIREIVGSETYERVLLLFPSRAESGEGQI